MTRKINYDCYIKYAKENPHLWIEIIKSKSNWWYSVEFFSSDLYDEFSKTLDYKFFELNYNIQILWEEIKKSLKLNK